MDIQELHTQAMELAEQADFLRMQGKVEDANKLYVQSLDVERQAAYEARDRHFGEPTESVLFRSAATLAYGLQDLRESERLVCMGLSGNPPQEIANELRDLYDKVSIERSLMQIDSDVDTKQREEVTITIPTQERNLLRALVRKFGWACIF